MISKDGPRQFSVSLVLVVALALLANCAPAEFSQSPEASGSPIKEGNPAGGNTPPPGPGGDDAGGNVPGAGGGDGTGEIPVDGHPDGDDDPGADPVREIAHVKFIGPACQRGTDCLVIFRLEKAYPHRFVFNWRTNDTLYTQTPPAGKPIFGRPNYHYVPTTGVADFAPGETEKRVYVKNINPDNVAITIGVIMSQCVYNSVQFNCSEAFGQ